MKSLRHRNFGFENGRNALRFRAEWLRFPQERHWPAENYLGIWSKDSPTGSSFCFILLPMANFGCDLIIWKNWRLTKAVMKKYCCVIADIDSKPAKSHGRSHAVPEANESARDLCSDIPESRENPTIESNLGFRWKVPGDFGALPG
jgi:hypothetical protein